MQEREGPGLLAGFFVLHESCAYAAVRGGGVIAPLVADIFEAAAALHRDGERTASSAGQTQARWQLLSVVSAGDWTVPMAADRLGTSRQAVQRIANELVDDGLAAFTENPRHRRSTFLRLTNEGTRVLDAISGQAQLRHRALLAKLDGIDLLEARAVNRRLTVALRSELEPKSTWA
jgi:DNA-binding MarR family transcriptional regulator